MRWSRGRIRSAPLTSAEADRLLPGVGEEERYSQAWLIGEGHVHAGHEAGWHTLYLAPGGWLLRPLRWLPFFQPVSRAVYRWIADHRSSACRRKG